MIPDSISSPSKLDHFREKLASRLRNRIESKSPHAKNKPNECSIEDHEVEIPEAVNGWHVNHQPSSKSSKDSPNTSSPAREKLRGRIEEIRRAKIAATKERDSSMQEHPIPPPMQVPEQNVEQTQLEVLELLNLNIMDSPKGVSDIAISSVSTNEITITPDISSSESIKAAREKLRRRLKEKIKSNSSLNQETPEDRQTVLLQSDELEPEENILSQPNSTHSCDGKKADTDDSKEDSDQATRIQELRDRLLRRKQHSLSSNSQK